jgi:hypothetical protein
MIEGELSVKYKCNQHHLTNDRTCLSWEWSVQQQETGWSWLSSHVVSARFHKTRLKRSKFLTSRFKNIEAEDKLFYETAKSHRVSNSQTILDRHYVYSPAMNMEHFPWQTGAQGRLHSETWALWLLLNPSQTQGCACASLDPSPWLGIQERNILISNYFTTYFALAKRRYLMTVSFMSYAFRMTTYRVS